MANFRLLARVNDNSQVAEYDSSDDSATLAGGFVT